MERYFKIIEYKNNTYIFNTLSFVTERVENARELISFENDKIPFEELDEELKRFLEQGKYVRKNRLMIREEQEGFDMVSFSFPPIHGCNLRCKYCFADHGDNYKGKNKICSEELVEQICNFMIDQYPKTEQFRLDFVSGGEPLLDSQITLRMIEVAQKVFRERNKKLFVWLCTNGTTITKTDALSLDRMGVRLGVSIDGEKNAHDAVRPFVNGKGSYDVITDKVGSILRDGDLSKQFKNIWALCTITAENHDFIAILKHLRELGFSGVQMKFIRVPKDNPLSLNERNIHEYERDIELYFSYLFGECQRNEYAPLMLIANDTDFVGKIVKRYFLNMPLANRCYAARNQCSITAEGKIFPCASFVGEDRFCIGDVSTGFDDEKRGYFLNRTVDQNPTCSKCWARYLCTGQCFSNCMYANGDIGMPEDLYCRIEKKIIQETVFHAMSLSKEMRERIVRLMRLKNYTKD